MSSPTSNLGLTIWTSIGDEFDFNILANNFTLIDNQFNSKSVSTVPIRFLETLATVPASGNTDGRLVYLTAADSGFPAKTVIEYAASAWKVVGPAEVQTAVPVSSNYVGRQMFLSSVASPWNAFDYIVNQDGANTWRRVDADTLISMAAFKALSGMPDGYRALVQADSANGINWNLRYNANSASIYKWETQGVSPGLFQEIDTSQTTTTTGSWVDLGTVGPQATNPVAGEFEILAVAQHTAPGGGGGTGQIGIFNGTSILTNSSSQTLVTSGTDKLVLHIPRVVLPGANTVIKLQYQTTLTGWGWSLRTLLVRPLRVAQA